MTTPKKKKRPPSPPPRPSRTLIFGGHRRGHVWVCFQHDRLSPNPTLLLQLSIPTHLLVKEMQPGLLQVTLSNPPHSQLRSCALHSVPVWTLSINGKQFGFAVRLKPTGQIRVMLQTVQSTTVGPGVNPSGLDPGGDLMYMRANYEWVIGGPDSESFHLINPG